MRYTVSRTALVAMVTSIALSGCGIFGESMLTSDDLTGDVTTQQRDHTGFTEIELRGSATVTVTVGEDFDVKVSTDSGLQEHVATSVNGDALVVEQDYTFTGTEPAIDVMVTMPASDALTVTGSGTIDAAGIDTDQIAFTVAGSGDIVVEGRAVAVTASVQGSGTIDTANLTVSRGTVTISGSGDAIVDVSSALDVDISGSGTITATGTAELATILISGSGEILGENFTANEAEIIISGSGDVAMGVRDSLEVEVTGSGDVIYYGNPQVDFDNTGSGSVSAG